MTPGNGSAGETGIEIRAVPADATVPLRHTVLWPDHPVSHVLLPEDASGHHYAAFPSGGDTPIAVISLFRDPLPLSSSALPAARFRKFACDPAHQGRGIGTRLLENVFSFAREDLGCDVVWCDARASAAGWYERRGMERFGDTFYKGDVEYIRMKRSFAA